MGLPRSSGAREGRGCLRPGLRPHRLWAQSQSQFPSLPTHPRHPRPSTATTSRSRFSPHRPSCIDDRRMRRAGSGRAGDLRGSVGVLSGLGWASSLRTVRYCICGRSLCVGSQIGDGFAAGGFLRSETTEPRPEKGHALSMVYPARERVCLRGARREHTSVWESNDIQRKKSACVWRVAILIYQEDRGDEKRKPEGVFGDRMHNVSLLHPRGTAASRRRELLSVTAQYSGSERARRKLCGDTRGSSRTHESRDNINQQTTQPRSNPPARSPARPEPHACPSVRGSLPDPPSTAMCR